MSEDTIPFDAEPSRMPTSIGRIKIELADEDGTTGGYAAYYEAQVVMDDGTRRTRRGNLVPHLTPAQRTALIGFVQDLRTQAEAQIL